MADLFNFKDEDIDPEMLELVKNFNKAGLETKFCCQGHFKTCRNGDEGMSIPYLTCKLPSSDLLLLIILKHKKKYPMITVNQSVQVLYNDKFDNAIDYQTITNEFDNMLDSAVDETLEFRVNPVFYNPPESVYNDTELYEKVFEYMRRRFVSELTNLSKDVLSLAHF